jgi:predicted transcriptional regulator YdeE
MASVKPPGLERHATLVFAGLRRHHSLSQSMPEIAHAVALQWRDFEAQRGGVKGLAAGRCHGVCGKVKDGAEGLDYVAGVQLDARIALPEGFSTLTLPPALYAVFQHGEPAATLYDSYRFLFGTVLPGAGLVPADGPEGVPEFIERYNPGFDFGSGLGGLEIMIPIED